MTQRHGARIKWVETLRSFRSLLLGILLFASPCAGTTPSTMEDAWSCQCTTDGFADVKGYYTVEYDGVKEKYKTIGPAHKDSEYIDTGKSPYVFAGCGAHTKYYHERTQQAGGCKNS